MITAFDRITIDVPDLRQAREQYQALLGPEDTPGIFSLGNIDIALRQGDSVGRAAITQLSLLDPSLPRGTQSIIDTHPRNITVMYSHHRAGDYSEPSTASGIYAIDHLVLQSGDADDCIRLFKQDLGLRLALDKDAPQWGGRMLFFRLGKMTLEIIEPVNNPPEQDYFWGITYLCHDIETTLVHLDALGIAHSGQRPGRKAGTSVATVKSHCLGLPTLLIGPG